MSFFENIGSLAEDLLGGASPQQLAEAVAQHVQNADPDELGQHLTESLGTLDGDGVAQLGRHLLQSFTNSSGAGASETAAAAGTTEAAVAAGDGGAVGALIAYAKGNPQVLQEAANAFIQRNPGAIAQLAPGLLQGIASRLGGAR